MEPSSYPSMLQTFAVVLPTIVVEEMYEIVTDYEQVHKGVSFLAGNDASLVVATPVVVVTNVLVDLP